MSCVTLNQQPVPTLNGRFAVAPIISSTSLQVLILKNFHVNALSLEIEGHTFHSQISAQQSLRIISHIRWLANLVQKSFLVIGIAWARNCYQVTHKPIVEPNTCSNKFGLPTADQVMTQVLAVQFGSSFTRVHSPIPNRKWTACHQKSTDSHIYSNVHLKVVYSESVSETANKEKQHNLANDSSPAFLGNILYKPTSGWT